MKAFTCIYLLLPLLLWPLTFIVFGSKFVYAMFFSVLILASLSLYKYGKYIKWNTMGYAKTAMAGVLFAFALYLIFVAGYHVSAAVGLNSSVTDVYSMLYAQNNLAILVILLAFIGLFEEIYWRGGLQGLAGKSRRFGRVPWMASTAYYTIVHIATLNPILVIAAFAVGLVTSIVAYRYGILASSISHILWIEAIIVFIPIIHA